MTQATTKCIKKSKINYGIYIKKENSSTLNNGDSTYGTCVEVWWGASQYSDDYSNTIMRNVDKVKI